MKILITAVLALTFISPAPCMADEPRHAATFQTDYQGPYRDLFAQQAERIRLLVQQAQLEISSRLGLFQYREGFRLPLSVRFADVTQPGVEHALAYVHFTQSSSGLAQEMIVNLSVCAQNPADFDSIFYHEMTHAVILDALDPQKALAIPRWVHEGLAEYISGEGPARVRWIAQHFNRATVGQAVHSIDSPGVDYAHAYLAIQYLEDKYSVNAVQGLVRDLIQGKNTQDAIEDVTGESYEEFRKHLQEYTLAVYQKEARSDVL